MIDPAARTPALEALFLTEAEIAALYEAIVELAQEMDTAQFERSELYPVYRKILKLWEGEKP